MANFTGRYEFVSGEKFDAFLTAIGAPEQLIQGILSAEHPVIEATQDGNHYSFKTIGMAKSFETEFNLDEDFENDLVGHKIKGRVSREGDRLLETRESEKGSVSIVREICGNNLVMTYTAGDIVAKRIYKRA